MSPRTDEFIFTVQTLGHLYERAMSAKPFVKQLWPMQVAIESINLECNFRESFARVPKKLNNNDGETEVVHFLAPGICQVNVSLLYAERFTAKMWKCQGIMVKMKDRTDGTYYLFKPLSLERTNKIERAETKCELKNLFGGALEALGSSVIDTNFAKKTS